MVSFEIKDHKGLLHEFKITVLHISKKFIQVGNGKFKYNRYDLERESCLLYT